MTDAWKEIPDERAAKPDELQMVYADLKLVQAANAMLAERLIADRARIARMEADLLECREFLEGYSDVVDGDYGEPEPNRAMQLVTMINCTLFGEAANLAQDDPLLGRKHA